MEKIIKKKGLILKTQDYKENASLVTILTNEEINTLILRGAKKPSSKNHLLNNIFSEITFNQTNDKSLNTLTEGTVLNSHYNIYQDVLKINYAYIIVEKILVLNSSITDFNTLYNFVIKVFDILDNTKYPLILINLFELKFMYLLGIGPIVNKCVLCDKKTNLNYFSISNGGIICPECKKGLSFVAENDVTTIIKFLYLINIDLINEDFLSKCDKFKDEINNIVDSYYEYYLDFKSKSKNIIRKIQ